MLNGGKVSRYTVVHGYSVHQLDMLLPPTSAREICYPISLFQAFSMTLVCACSGSSMHTHTNLNEQEIKWYR